MINSSLPIGHSALRANQAALQVIGNNIANASSPDYTRQRPITEPLTRTDATAGMTPGIGVKLTEVRRMTDEALNARLRAASSENAAAQAGVELFAQIETILNPLGDDNIASRIDEFFDSFSELANDPQSSARRTMVLLAGQAVARSLNYASAALDRLQVQVDGQISALVDQANRLLVRVADLNKQIATAEIGLAGGASPLRDQRDAALGQLAELINFETYTGSGGMVNVYIGSTPLVYGGDHFALRADATSGTRFNVYFEGTQNAAPLTGGKIGGLLAGQADGIQFARDRLDELAAELIAQVNAVHSTGQPVNSASAITASERVSDATAVLSSVGLAVAPVNGTFTLHLTDVTGRRFDHVVTVDLNGVGDDDSLVTLAGKIDLLDRVSATVTADNRLQLQAEDGYSLSFSHDSSNILASLGINTFFTGSGATTIAVRAGLGPGDIAASANHLPGDNTNALNLAALGQKSFAGLGRVTLSGHFTHTAVNLAAMHAEADSRMQASGVLAEALTSQRDSIAGVSLDEEALDLMKFQRAFQGVAHYLSLVNELIGQLIALV